MVRHSIETGIRETVAKSSWQAAFANDGSAAWFTDQILSFHPTLLMDRYYVKVDIAYASYSWTTGWTWVKAGAHRVAEYERTVGTTPTYTPTCW